MPSARSIRVRGWLLSCKQLNPCGEGACSRWSPKDSLYQRSWCVRLITVASFAAAAQPSGSKLPHHTLAAKMPTLHPEPALMLLPHNDWLPQAPLQPLDLDWLTTASIEVAILRLDRIDPLISGNKWFKLIEHLNAADRIGAQGIISLGGAYSNHLHALAAAGKRFDFKTVGLLRGHPLETPTVKDLQAFGMQLHWLGYGGYRARHEAGFWLPWQVQYPDLYPVPEGGGRLRGARGCRQLKAMVLDQLGDLEIG